MRGLQVRIGFVFANKRPNLKVIYMYYKGQCRQPHRKRLWVYTKFPIIVPQIECGSLDMDSVCDSFIYKHKQHAIWMHLFLCCSNEDWDGIPSPIPLTPTNHPLHTSKSICCTANPNKDLFLVYTVFDEQNMKYYGLPQSATGCGEEASIQRNEHRTSNYRNIHSFRYAGANNVCSTAYVSKNTHTNTKPKRILYSFVEVWRGRSACGCVFFYPVPKSYSKHSHQPVEYNS